LRWLVEGDLSIKRRTCRNVCIGINIGMENTSTEVKHADHVETLSPLLKESMHPMPQIVCCSSTIEYEIVEASIDALKIGQTSNQLRLAANWSPACWPDEASRAGTHSFYRF